MHYDNAINEIAELVKASPNEPDTRIEAKKILKRFLYEAAYSAETLAIVKIEDEDIDLNIKVGGTD